MMFLCCLHFSSNVHAFPMLFFAVVCTSCVHSLLLLTSCTHPGLLACISDPSCTSSHIFFCSFSCTFLVIFPCSSCCFHACMHVSHTLLVQPSLDYCVYFCALSAVPPLIIPVILSILVFVPHVSPAPQTYHIMHKFTHLHRRRHTPPVPTQPHTSLTQSPSLPAQPPVIVQPCTYGA